MDLFYPVVSVKVHFSINQNCFLKGEREVIKKRFLSVCLSLFMLAALICVPPGVAHVSAMEKPAKSDVNYGVDIDALMNPDNGVYLGAFRHANGYTLSYGQYTDVTYEDSESPILWQTMGEDDSAVAGGDGNLTLLSKYVLDIRKWTNMGNGFIGDDGQPNIWKISTISAWLNNTEFTGKTLKDKLILDAVPEDFTYTGFLNSFSPAEKAQLASSEVTTSKFAIGSGYAGIAFAQWPSLLGENVTQVSTDYVYLPWMSAPATSGDYAKYGNRVWLGSKDAVNNEGWDNSMYLDEQKEKQATLKGSDQTVSYWGRNPSTAFDSMVVWTNADGTTVNYDGSSNLGGISTANGIRPVTKLNPKNILYASPVVENADGNPAYTQANEYYKVSDTGTNYKLTLVDSSLSFSANPTDQALESGGTVSFYGAASVYSDEVVYKIVDNSTDKTAGYGIALENPTGNNQEIVIPTKDMNGNNLSRGEYTVYVWAQKNNSIHSNTGSVPVSFTMTVAAPGTDTALNVEASSGNLGELITQARGIYDLSEITSITVTGTVNTDDMKWLQSVNGDLTKLKTLDMSGAVYELGSSEWTYVIPTNFMSTNADQKVLETFLAPSPKVRVTDFTGNSAPDGYWVQPSAFKGVTSLKTASLPGVTMIAESAFQDSGLENLYAPDLADVGTYYAIGVNAFSGSKLKVIDFPNVSVLSWGAFNNMTELEYVNLPNVTSTSNGIFSGCTKLKVVRMPKAESISGNMFSGCTSLEHVILSSVTDIGNNAFKNCSKLSSYTFGTAVPNITDNDGWGSSFTGSYASPTYYVPDDSEFHTWESEGWKWAGGNHEYTIKSVKVLTDGNIDDLSAVPGETPADMIDEEQFFGIVTWENEPETFSENETYNANITLFEKPGYTLRGLDKSFFKVPGATVNSFDPLTGRLSVTFDTTVKSLTKDSVVLLQDSYTYDGTEKKPEVKVSDEQGTLLVEGTDYSVSYSNNVDAGSSLSDNPPTVKITGMGRYSGTVEKTFTITPKALTVENTAVKDKVYDGTTNAEFSGTPSLAGLVDGDKVTLVNGVPSFADKNAGKEKKVTFTEFSLEGEDAGNYSLTQPEEVSASISKATLTATYVGDSIVFGEEPAYVVEVSGFINNETADTAEGYTAPSIAESDKPDISKNIKISMSLTPSGGEADNYSFIYKEGTFSMSTRTSISIPTTTYSVRTNSNGAYGTVTVSPETAKSGDTVTITAEPDKGYQTGTVTVTTSDGETVEVTENNGTYTFTMPKDEVTVSVTFDKKAIPFTDVKEGSWYYDSVDYVYLNDMMVGTSDSLFSPDMSLTRGMLVTILWRLEGSPAAGPDAIEFSDVDSSQWYADAVAWASSEGIVAGYDNGQFGPEDDITREQLATIMYRYASFKGYDTSARSVTTFSDNDQISSYAVESMSWANATGLLQGMGDNQISPQTGATRGQVAAVITRFCEKNN
jgi:hypothetical protein